MSASRSAILRPRFYLLVTMVLVAFVVAAFSPSYYLRLLTDPPQLTTVLHVHAAVFSVWLVLFLVQAWLVAARRVDLHRRLGVASAAFAVVVFAVGVLSALETAISDHVSPSGLAPAQFSIVPLTSIALFGAFVGLGVIYRHRPELHRRFMVLAFIATISPAVARILRFLDLQPHRNVLIPAVAGMFVAVCMLYDWRRHRRVHASYVIGGLVVVASWPLRLVVGRSEWWFPVGEGVARMARALFG